MQIGLSIVFTGLCALVTDGRGGTGQVLLVDTKGISAVDGIELPDHAPTLVVGLSSLANAESSHPTRVALAWPSGGSVGESGANGTGSSEQIGFWDLSGSEVRIRVQGEGESGLRSIPPADEASSWPEPPTNVNDPVAWRDLRYVADMKLLAGDGRIDPALLANEPRVSGVLPRAVAARIYLEGGVVEGGMPSQAAYRDGVFEFRAAASAPALRQALTDTVRWSLASNATAVVLEIIPLTGGPPRRLVFKPRAAQHTVFISNLPVENVAASAHHAVSEEEMAALHFGAYYGLLKSRPETMPLPRLWINPVAHRRTGIMGTVFCPPAVFQRD